MPEYFIGPAVGWGARDIKGPMTRAQLRSMAALMLAQGLPASSPGPALKTLYQMKGDDSMPHSVPAFGYYYGADPVPTRMPMRRTSQAANTQMMMARHAPRPGGFRPVHRCIRADIDFDAMLDISGDTAPMITLTGDFDPNDPVMAGLLGSIAKGVTSVVKSVAAMPAVKVAVTPIKAVTHPAATIKSVAKAITNPIGTIKSIPAAAVSQAKETLQAANTLRQSGIVKAGVAGLAIAVPPVGLPIAGALALTNKVMDNAKSVNPVVSAAATALIAGTAAQAKAGDPDAQRAMNIMSAQSQVAKITGPKKTGFTQEFHFQITNEGRILRL